MILPQFGARAARVEQARALLDARPGSALAGGLSAAVMIVEDDSDGGCSWCPVVTEARKEDEHASIAFWKKGEQLREVKDRAGAIDCYNRGVVSDPRNTACWLSISEVNPEGNIVLQLDAVVPWTSLTLASCTNTSRTRFRSLCSIIGPDNKSHPGNCFPHLGKTSGGCLIAYTMP